MTRIKYKEAVGLEAKKGKPSIAYAMIYVGIGDNDLAIELLEKAYEERSSELVKLKVHPFYDSLRSDPRFIALLKKMNLE
ncbi:MAG: hypothetical protein GQ544_07270 [Candidatus Aminicenantes bacterium]|nr:hypothetical protein [Candidatus Aminicenantes bacterium]